MPLTLLLACWLSLWVGLGLGFWAGMAALDAVMEREHRALLRRLGRG